MESCSHIASGKKEKKNKFDSHIERTLTKHKKKKKMKREKKAHRNQRFLFKHNLHFQISITKQNAYQDRLRGAMLRSTSIMVVKISI